MLGHRRLTTLLVPVLAAIEGPLGVTTVEKLSLPTNTAVGTQVRVSDGFYVSGTGTSADGFYVPNGTLHGKTFYNKVGGSVDDNFVRWSDIVDDEEWEIYNVDGLVFFSPPTVEYANPWDVPVEAWLAGGAGNQELPPTLTHPALQQLAAPSSAQGGVFVAGGTQDGVFSKRGIVDGKDFFNLVGVEDDTNTSVVHWTSENLFDVIPSGTAPAQPGWLTRDQTTAITYYSLSDVATPDLGGTDKFVMAVSGVAYSQRGTFNGKSYYNKIGSTTSTSLDSIFWSSATWHITNAIGVDLDTSTSNVATPDLATFLLGTVVTNTAWLNASDDSPASITVTSVTGGQLTAGIKRGSVTSVVNGNLNGRPVYSELGAPINGDTKWHPEGPNWQDDNIQVNLGNVAFPYLGAPEVTVDRDDVATEANWEEI